MNSGEPAGAGRRPEEPPGARGKSPGGIRAAMRVEGSVHERPGDAEFDHVAIAARSFDELLPLLERVAGVPATEPRRVESQGVEVCFVGDVELIRPLTADSGVARFIERRGAGLHHIAYRVADVEAAMEGLAAQGYRFTSAGPTAGAGGHRIAFMHPRTAGGVLVELVERG